MHLSEVDTTPKYIFTVNSCMTPYAYGDVENGGWLNAAISLDAALMETAPEVKDIVDKLFDHIILQIEADGLVKNTSSKKTLSRVKATCKVILLNLYTAYLLGVPVRYSRDNTRYKRNTRYGKIFGSSD